MSNRKNNAKVYRNADRGKPEVYKKYVPNYKQLGIDPIEFNNGVNSDEPTIHTPVVSYAETNTRARKLSAPVRQDYGNATTAHNNGPVPNVGNNMEHTWSSVDGEFTDDLPADFDHNHQMIDNNDYISESSFGSSRAFMTQQDIQGALNSEKNEDKSILSSLTEEPKFLLLLEGKIFSSGSLEFIQDLVKELVFGTHELCNGMPISVDLIKVLKIENVKIKIGVFLE